MRLPAFLTPRFCLDFASVAQSPRALAQAGSKGAVLAELASARYPIPAGVVVLDAAFQRFVRHNRLAARVAQLTGVLEWQSPAALRKAADHIQTWTLDCEIPDGIWTDVTRALAQLGDHGALIVRSSALGEDAEDTSFAGQLDSFEIAGDHESLRLGLLRCWASFWSERSLFYQRARQRTLRGMGVVIQRYVHARAAGVLFTRRPMAIQVPAPPDWMYGEYCAGAGKALVGGEVTPGAFAIDSRSGRGQVLRTPEQAEATPLSAATLAALGALGRKLEASYGRAQDVEWVLDRDDGLWLVQSRPITSAVPRLVHWSNVNVNENYPDPIAPLLYSIALRSYYHYFSNLGRSFGVSEARLARVDQALRNIIGVHEGRMYYNLSNIYSCILQLPFGEHLVRYFDLFVGAREEQRGDATPPLPLGALEVVRIPLKAAASFALLPWRVRTFVREVAQSFAWDKPLDVAQARRELAAFLHIRFESWRKAGVADVAAMISYGLLKSFFARHLEGSGVSHNTMLKGIAQVISSKPPEALWLLAEQVRQDPELHALFAKPSAEVWQALSTDARWSQFATRLNAFLRDYGFRCSGELMLTVPNYQERPEAALDLVKGYLSTAAASPTAILAAQAREQRQLAKQLGRRLRPLPRAAFLALVAQARRAIAARERVRHEQARLYGRLRQVALVLAEDLARRGILAAKDDVFFLSYNELTRAAAGAEMFPTLLAELAAQRKRAFAPFAESRPPDHFTLVEGAYLGTQDLAQTPHPVAHAASELIGTGACGGRVRGEAAVLESVFQAEQLRPGDILVTRQTDPGWAPVFPLIKGLVIERGGMLSHGAIVAREFGIPTVVGVRDATTRLRSRQTIVVDGDRGHVDTAPA